MIELYFVPEYRCLTVTDKTKRSPVNSLELCLASVNMGIYRPKHFSPTRPRSALSCQCVR